MEIKDFVKKTLLEISEAIDEANDEFGGTRKFQLSMGGAKTIKEAKTYSLVEFDLAVVASTTARGKKGGNLKVAVINANMDSEKEYVSNSTSRVKFVVMDNL